MAENYDVVVIGGGLAGSITAENIAKAGYNVLILEEHREAGKPLQCAGLVTQRIFEHLPENNCVINKIRGARIYSPSGQTLEIDARKVRAVVIDRVKFDQTCMSIALRAGAELRLGAKAIGAKYTSLNSENCLVVKFKRNGQEHSVNCKILVAADGVQSQVARWFGLKGPEVILSGFGTESIGAELDPGFVELYLGNEIAPNFFAWVIPKTDKPENGFVPVRIGLACTESENNALYYYNKFFSHPILGPKLERTKPIQFIAGGIPIGTVPRSYTDNVMLVGDAAGQVKPTSGGGVYTGIICAKHCAAVANSALEEHEYSKKHLKAYQKSWFDELGKELKRGLRLHKVYMHLRDDQLEEGFRLLSDPKILELISKKGDIDYPSKVTSKIFKLVPQMLMFAKPYLRSLF